jgi:hypothetical protein
MKNSNKNSLYSSKMIDVFSSSLIDSKCESEMKIMEEQGVGGHDPWFVALGGRGVC